MDRGRMKLRICLVCVVLLAVVMGVIYYCFYLPDSGNFISEGTLVFDCDDIYQDKMRGQS